MTEAQLKAEGRRRTPSGKTLGWLSVVGVVVAFSLGSTLVKRAHSPGVLVAFWRLVTTTVIWNVVLVAIRKRPSVANFKQALIPGVLFGLNLTTFYAGATFNSVANAELIASLTPFLVVPIGAKFFHEHINSRALAFVLVGFGGVTLVLFSAPAKGDASLKGNVFGVVSMVLWATYVATTRHYRRQMDVVSFMATITPIAAVTVLPLALVHGGLTTVSSTGWTYVLVLTFLTGVGAHGLMVYAQKSIPIGTIGIAQVAQPALAAFWSFLLLDEELHGWQLVGMAVVLSGLLGFIVLNRRPAGRQGHLSESAIATEGSGATV